jgi:hypothetical protein
VAFASLAATACHRPEHFESVGQLTRTSVVDVDEHGEPATLDVAFEWDPCPGDQFQTVRGGAEFARCMAKYRVGDYVAVGVQRTWDTHGYYVWDVDRMGDCVRPSEGRHTPGSFAKTQECHPLISHGREYGFRCELEPWQALVEICPWMRKS